MRLTAASTISSPMSRLPASRIPGRLAQEHDIDMRSTVMSSITCRRTSRKTAPAPAQPSSRSAGRFVEVFGPTQPYPLCQGGARCRSSNRSPSTWPGPQGRARRRGVDRQNHPGRRQHLGPASATRRRTIQRVLAATRAGRHGNAGGRRSRRGVVFLAGAPGPSTVTGTDLIVDAGCTARCSTRARRRGPTSGIGRPAGAPAGGASPSFHVGKVAPAIPRSAPLGCRPGQAVGSCSTGEPDRGYRGRRHRA